MFDDVTVILHNLACAMTDGQLFYPEIYFIQFSFAILNSLLGSQNMLIHRFMICFVLLYSNLWTPVLVS